MGFFELLLIAVSLAMDAFSVSICGSLALSPSSRFAGAVKFGAWFGAFQFLMPVIGYWTAYWAVEYIEAYDHWIAFFLLLYIGINMIREAGEDAEVIESYGVKRMFLLAVATSIDALAVGVSFAVLDVNIWTSSLLIGVVTFIISFLGGTIGFKLGERFRNHATRTGGLVLCLIGLKVLLEHTGYL